MQLLEENLKKYLLKFSAAKQQRILEQKELYFFIANLPLVQQNFIFRYITKIKRKTGSKSRIIKRNLRSQFFFYKKKSNHKNFRLNEKLNYLYLFRHMPTALFLSKICNLLMHKGKKELAYTIILKVCEILKVKFHILNPIKILMYFIYLNLVPLLQTKSVGYKTKKVLGINLTPYKRMSLSLKLFIKGARSHNVPIVMGLITEFFNFLKKKTLLQSSNLKTLHEISVNHLHKFLKYQTNNLMPEFSILTESTMNFANLYAIDWKNFAYIIDNLDKIALSMKLYYQKRILFALKNYVLVNYKIKGVESVDFVRPKGKGPVMLDNPTYRTFVQYFQQNKNNLDFLPYFIKELYERLSLEDLDLFTREQDFVDLFLGLNPKQLELNLNFNNFKSVHKKMYYLFADYKKWNFKWIRTNELSIFKYK